MALNDLGANLARLERYDEALKIYEEARELRKSGDVEELVVTLQNIAVAHRKNGDPVQAQALYTEALQRGVDALGPLHARVITIRSNYGYFLLRQGQIENARV